MTGFAGWYPNQVLRRFAVELSSSIIPNTNVGSRHPKKAG